MKTSMLPPATALVLSALLAHAQEPELPPPQIIEKGPHHRTWERTTTELLTDGRRVQRRSSYVELACGMHYLKDGVYHETRPEIELFQDGAVARHGPHQVIFSPNFNSAGLIDVLTPDGKRLRSHILGLGVYDAASGQSTLIAEPKDSIGELHPPNQVLYRQAFDAVKPGTVLTTYATTANDYGLALINDAHLSVEGSAEHLARIVRHNLIQEPATTNWSARLEASVLTPLFTPARAPSARFRATYWSSPADDTSHFNGYYGTNFAVEFKDCQFFGGRFMTEGPTVNITNCFFGRVGLFINEWAWNLGPSFQNNTFSGGWLDLYQDQDTGVSSTWTFKNNLFDDSLITNSVVSTMVQNFNAFTANATRLTPTNTTDIVLSVTNIAFETCALGRFYLPTNLTSLFNSGSTNANYLGLFQYTCTTNQVKETNSMVDIGFHLVSLNASGQPADSDSDGIPDYLENFTGSGLVNSGETSWTNATDIGLKVVITRPKNGASIP